MLEGGRIESLFDPPLTYLYRNRPFNVEESESRVAMLKLLLAYGTIYFFSPFNFMGPTGKMKNDDVLFLNGEK